MNQAVPVYAVLLAAAVAAGLYLIYVAARRGIDSARRSFEEAAKLAAEIEKLRTALAPLTELLPAITRIADAQLEILQIQRGQARPASPGVPNPFGGRTNGVAQRDLGIAQMEYDIEQLRRSEGISREEAALRLQQTGTSVWDGAGGILQDWGARP